MNRPNIDYSRAQPAGCAVTFAYVKSVPVIDDIWYSVTLFQPYSCTSASNVLKQGLNPVVNAFQIFAPTGPLNRDFDDVRRFGDAAQKGIQR